MEQNTQFQFGDVVEIAGDYSVLALRGARGVVIVIDAPVPTNMIVGVVIANPSLMAQGYGHNLGGAVDNYCGRWFKESDLVLVRDRGD